MKNILVIILGLFIILAIGFGLEWLGIVKYSFLAPKMENAKREVYESSSSYIEGKRLALSKYYSEWKKASPEEKNSIRAVVLQDFISFDQTKFTSTQKAWYDEIINTISYEPKRSEERRVGKEC